MTTTNPCCEKCFVGLFNAWEACSSPYCPCHAQEQVPSWEDRIRKLGFGDDLVRFISDVVSAEQVSLREKVEGMKKSVVNFPHGDSNAVRRKKAYNHALDDVLALIDEV